MRRATLNMNGTIPLAGDPDVMKGKKKESALVKALCVCVCSGLPGFQLCSTVLLCHHKPDTQKQLCLS